MSITYNQNYFVLPNLEMRYRTNPSLVDLIELQNVLDKFVMYFKNCYSVHFHRVPNVNKLLGSQFLKLLQAINARVSDYVEGVIQNGSTADHVRHAEYDHEAQ